MLDRVRIWTLRQAGHTLEEIAASVGVGKSSVQRILKEPPITSPESAPTPASRRIGRPSQVEAFQGDVERILEAEPLLPTVEVLSRLRSLGYTGGKSAVYELVRSVRPRKGQGPEVRFEGVPGEFSQHDFGSVNVTYADRTSEKIHFFASRLKYSRWTHVAIVPDEKVESLIRALLKAFESFGGVPLRAFRRHSGDQNALFRFRYDEARRMTSKEFCASDGSRGQDVFSYDASGVLREAEFGNSDRWLNGTLSVVGSERGLPSRAVYKDRTGFGADVTFEYDERSLLQKIVWTLTDGRVQVYSYSY